MESCKSTKMIERGERKIQSVYIIKKCVLEPIDKLLVDTSVMSLRNIEKQRFFLVHSRCQLASLTSALLENRCINNEIRSDVEETVQALKRVIPLLEEKIEMYKKIIVQKNNEINISNLRRWFHDPTFFQQIMQDILVVYEEPSNNFHFGEVVRSVLVDLNKLERTTNFDKLQWRVKQCQMCLQEVEECLLACDQQNQKDDFGRVHKSLVRLLEMCRIVITNPEKEIK